MTREEIKNIFPEATNEQLKNILDINTKDIGRAKGDFDNIKSDLDKAQGTITEYEKTISELKKDIESEENFKVKFQKLEKKIADEKAENERKKKEAEIEADYKSRFESIVGENKWRDELTEKAVYYEFKKAISDKANKGKGDKDIFDELTKDKNYYKNPNSPSDMSGMGYIKTPTVTDNQARAVMGLPPIK